MKKINLFFLFIFGISTSLYASQFCPAKVLVGSDSKLIVPNGWRVTVNKVTAPTPNLELDFWGASYNYVNQQQVTNGVISCVYYTVDDPMQSVEITTIQTGYENPLTTYPKSQWFAGDKITSFCDLPGVGYFPPVTDCPWG